MVKIDFEYKDLCDSKIKVNKKNAHSSINKINAGTVRTVTGP